MDVLLLSFFLRLFFQKWKHSARHPANRGRWQFSQYLQCLATNCALCPEISICTRCHYWKGRTNSATELSALLKIPLSTTNELSLAALNSNCFFTTFLFLSRSSTIFFFLFCKEAASRGQYRFSILAFCLRWNNLVTPQTKIVALFLIVSKKRAQILSGENSAEI